MSHSRSLVLAFAGDASSADAIGRLGDRLLADIVTVTVDLGQGDDLEQVREQATAAGAARAHVVDARERFAGEVLLPVLRAGAAHPGATTPASLARPMVVAVLIEIARMERAFAVAHGATGDARAAIGRLIADAAPDLMVVALEDVAPIPATRQPRVTANLWGRLVRWPVPGPGEAPDRSIYSRTTDPLAGHPHPAVVEMTFERGQPTAINGIPMRFPELVEVLDTIAGDHGVGRADRTRRRASGTEREIGESPAAVTLSAALDEIERAALGSRLLTLKSSLVPQYAALANDGGWFSSARRSLDAFNDSAMAAITGTVRVMLFRGGCRVVGCEVGPVAAVERTAKDIGAAQPAI
jgi:argininosuccinate synthase